MEKFLKNISFILDKLTSRPKIGGLYITDLSLQYLLIDGENLKTASLRLPPGIIVEGRLKNQQVFLEILRQFHNLIKPNKPYEKIKVIVNIPAEILFVQSFTVPYVEGEDLEEAARLNMEMISPLPRDKAYLSWQKIGETKDSYIFLGAVAAKEEVDKLTSCLKEVNFHVVAVEFPALALKRLLTRIKNFQEETLAIYVSSDGINLFLIKDNELYFEHFRSWFSLQGDVLKISREVFEKTIIEETQKVINFTFNRFKKRLDKVILIAPGFEAIIKDLLVKNFNLKVGLLTDGQILSLGPTWFCVLGSALRGIYDRAQDQEISLAAFSSLQEYYQEQTLNFVILWRNIIISVALLFLVVFVGVDLFLNNAYQKAKVQSEAFNTQPVMKELNDLDLKVREFNQLVEIISNIKAQDFDFYQILTILDNSLKKHKINLGYLNFTQEDVFKLNGQAFSQVDIIGFKNDLSKEKIFREINLSKDNIVLSGSDSFSFNMDIKLSASY